MTKVYLDFEHSHTFRRVDVVPDAEVVSVLGYDYIAVWYPLYIAAVIQYGRLTASIYVIQVQLQYTQMG